MSDSLKDMCEGLDWLRTQTLPAQIQLTVAKDRAISEALHAIQPLWTKEEIARRCVLMRSVGEELETLFVDGHAVIVFYPVETVQQWLDDKIVITFTQRFRRVQAVTLQAANQ